MLKKLVQSFKSFYSYNLLCEKIVTYLKNEFSCLVGSSKKVAVIGGIVGVTLVVILLVLFICIRQAKRSKRVDRGKHTFIIYRERIKG